GSPRLGRWPRSGGRWRGALPGDVPFPDLPPNRAPPGAADGDSTGHEPVRGADQVLLAGLLSRDLRALQGGDEPELGRPATAGDLHDDGARVLRSDLPLLDGGAKARGSS